MNFGSAEEFSTECCIALADDAVSDWWCDMVYPAYCTFKALSARHSKELNRLLILWTVIGIVHFGELATDYFISWFPFYGEIKIAFYLWLVFPNANGARYLYISYIKPYLQQHEKRIDEHVGIWKKRVRKMIGDSGTRFLIHLQSYVNELLASSPESEDVIELDTFDQDLKQK